MGTNYIESNNAMIQIKADSTFALNGTIYVNFTFFTDPITATVPANTKFVKINTYGNAVNIEKSKLRVQTITTGDMTLIHLENGENGDVFLVNNDGMNTRTVEYAVKGFITLYN